MSWMDSWSRPSANSKVPAPLYLTGEDVPYCHTCGRVMSTKKTDSKKKNSNNVVKYCSDRCRNRKPGALDRKIEHTVASLLNGEDDAGLDQTLARTRAVKGDPRLIVTCDEIEAIVFGSRFDPERTSGRRKNRRSRAIGEKSEWKSVDMEDPKESDEDDGDYSDEDSRSSTHSEVGGVRVRLPQDIAEENFSAMGGERGAKEKIVESEEDLARRRAGAKRAEEREMVRRAVRRIVIFGVEVPRREERKGGAKSEGGKGASKKHKKLQAEEEEVEEKDTEMRKGEALMAGMVVEPSFAKGNWSVRWRD
ncbi:related to chitinase [Ramularia collo-cygni]|uniref:Related to chitinase n=1 Tax=Ramularia collo-cygni TaxID=112498 RepID=A0A2D3UQY1_9PEZI|nr:related to chitinase [Ramularia collo-cygni]CZT19402.1 related to chitinase [Ramularia collo-cygni]